MTKFKDHTGAKYNMLTFMKLTDRRNKNGHMVWEILCDCGNIIFQPTFNITSGKTKSCGCLYRSRSSINGSFNRQFSPMISSARSIWRSGYRKCPFDMFMILTKEPCYYCSLPPSNVYNKDKFKSRINVSSKLQLEQGDFTYSGLDRIDVSLDHVIDNIVPCCEMCNRMKSHHGLKKFLAQITKMNTRIAQLHGLSVCDIAIDIEQFLANARSYVRQVLIDAGISLIEIQSVSP